MLSTRHHEALQSFNGDVQQSIYEDMDRVANGGPINRKIIDFMEYLIDKASGGGGGGVPSGNGGGPPGGPPDKGGDSNSSSSSSSSVNSPTTSKKTRKDISGVEALLQVIASQGAGGKNKEKQFSDYEDKMIMNSKHDVLLDIPKKITLESLSEWRYSYTSVFQTFPWSIDADSILYMRDIDDPSNELRLRSSTLSKHLVSKLTKGGFTSLIKEFEHLIQKGHSVTLFFNPFDELFPQTTNKILDYIGSLGNMFQQSGETANDFKIRSSRIWEWIETLGCDNLGDIRRAFLQKGILEGAYKTGRCVKNLDAKLIHGDLKLDDYTEESFTKQMTSMFTNSNVYDNGIVKSMNGGKAAGRGRAATT